MFSSVNDIVPFSQARTRLSDHLIAEIQNGSEKIITRNDKG